MLSPSEDSTVLSSRQKPRRQITRKDKGKINMLEYGTKAGALDHSESETARSGDGPTESRSESAKRAIKSAK